MVVDFSTRREIKSINGMPIIVPKTGKEYLDVCKFTLEKDDYIDILCGIMDQEIYNELEPVIQRVIDNYFNLG